MTAADASAAPRTPLRTILVRHGATSWSKNGQHTGRTDVPLAAEGETAARALRSKLQGFADGCDPGLVLQSPLQRAVETCRLAGFGDEALTVDDLVEWDYGDFEGMTTAEIRAEHPGWDLFRDGCPGGESLGDVVSRVGRVISRLREDRSLDGCSAYLFAHGHVLRVFAAMWAELRPEAARALPLETSKLGVLGWYHEDPALEAWNL